MWFELKWIAVVFQMSLAYAPFYLMKNSDCESILSINTMNECNIFDIGITGRRKKLDILQHLQNISQFSKNVNSKFGSQFASRTFAIVCVGGHYVFAQR